MQRYEVVGRNQLYLKGLLQGEELAPDESVLMPDSGKLPLTAGFNDVDGAGGAGLVPFGVDHGLRHGG